jgi:hypothetical protein
MQDNERSQRHPGCYFHTTYYSWQAFGGLRYRTCHICRPKFMIMGTSSNQAGTWLSFLRKLIGAATIYALVTQPLLLAVVGTPPAQASVVDALSLSLCLHQTDGTSPAAPADQQRHPTNDHCLLCFSGAFHLLGASDPSIISTVDREVRKLRQTTRPPQLASSSLYSVARPRGPPLSA